MHEASSMSEMERVKIILYDIITVNIKLQMKNFSNGRHTSKIINCVTLSVVVSQKDLFAMPSLNDSPAEVLNMRNT